PAFSPSTSACAKPSRISRRRFIGSASTATSSPPLRLITARIEEIFSASLAQAPKSASRPSMQCASSTARSPSTGGWQTSTRSCSSWARSLHCRRLEKVDAHEVARLTFQKGGGDIRIIEPDVLLRQRVNQLL